MKAGRFYSKSYDMRHHPKCELLQEYYGGGIEGCAAYGRWNMLMEIIYDQDGLVKIDTELRRRWMARELRMQDTEELKEFLTACADCDLISAELLEAGSVTSKGICEQLEYSRQKAEAGKQGGNTKKAKTKAGA